MKTIITSYVSTFNKGTRITVYFILMALSAGIGSIFFKVIYSIIKGVELTFNY